MTSEITISEELFHFIREHASDRYRLQLVLFFADHPCARFNELAIIHALNRDGGRRCLQKALEVLLDREMIKTCTDTNVIVYSLPENMRNVVLELAKLDIRQRQLLLGQTCPDSVRKGGSRFGDTVAKVLPEIPAPAIADK